MRKSFALVFVLVSTVQFSHGKIVRINDADITDTTSSKEEENGDELACGSCKTRLRESLLTITTLKKELKTVEAEKEVAEGKLEELISGTSTVYNKISGIYDTVACEFKTANLSCPAGKEIRIEKADYGRNDHYRCSTTWIETTDCTTNNALKLVKEKCSSTQSCRIDATNSVFGDPCVYTLKYLSISYSCVDAEATMKNNNHNILKMALKIVEAEKEQAEGKLHELISGTKTVYNTTTGIYDTVACEWKTAILSCPAGKDIQIEKADYGRNDNYTCSTTRIERTNCTTKNAMKVVKKKCSATHSCRIDATNTVFGDPCVYTYKYLSISYSCVDAKAE